MTYILFCSVNSGDCSCSGSGKAAVMSMFYVLLCNMIPAHHILPAGSAEEVSAATSSSGVSLGRSATALSLSNNVLTSILVWFVWLFLMLTVSRTLLCLSFFSSSFSTSSLYLLMPPTLHLSTLPTSTCVCQLMRMGSATSTTSGSTPYRTCCDTSTPTPSLLNLEAQLTSHYAPMYKCSGAQTQVISAVTYNTCCVHSTFTLFWYTFYY